MDIVKTSEGGKLTSTVTGRLDEDAAGVVRRLWRTLKALGLVDNSPVAFRAALAEGPA